MNYRMTQEFRTPFRINALIEEAGPLKVVWISFSGLVSYIVHIKSLQFFS